MNTPSSSESEHAPEPEPLADRQWTADGFTSVSPSQDKEAEPAAKPVIDRTNQIAAWNEFIGRDPNAVHVHGIDGYLDTRNRHDRAMLAG